MVPNVTISAQRLLFHMQRYKALGGRLPSEDYLRSLGLSEGELEASEQRFPVLLISLAAESAAAQLGNPIFGLVHAAELDGVEKLFLQELTQNAETLIEFIDLISRYTCIHTEIATFEIRHEKSGVTAVVFQSPVNDQLSYHQLDGTFTILCNAIHRFCGKTPLRVELAHLCPESHLADYEKTYRCPVIFGTSESALYLPTAQMLSPRHAKLSQRFLLKCERKREKLYGENFEEKVEFLIRRLLIRGEPKREQIAEALCISLRTFQRNLTRHDTTYQKLLENIRKKMAYEYICQSHFSVTQTALLLGYSEASQFYKAFRRWYHQSPSQLKAAGQT